MRDSGGGSERANGRGLRRQIAAKKKWEERLDKDRLKMRTDGSDGGGDGGW